MKRTERILCLCLAALMLALFSGCEMYTDRSRDYDRFMVENGPPDGDGDGLSDEEEATLYRTSPVLADTDGDGFSDYDEIVNFSFESETNPYDFNPLVSDLPDFSVNLISEPAIVLDMTAMSGTTKRIEKGTSYETAQSHTSIDTWHHGWNVEITNTFGGEAGGLTIGKTNWQVSISLGYEGFYETSSQNTREDRWIKSSLEAFEQSEEITESSGIIRILAEVVNRSAYAYKVDNMVMAAYVLEPGDGNTQVMSPVGQLVLDVSGTFQPFPDFTIGPGQVVGPLVFTEDHLDLGTTKKILYNSRSLRVVPIIAELVDPYGIPLAFNLTEVNNKTAEIVIDYGPMADGEGVSGRPRNEIYRVATKGDPANPGMPLTTALNEVLRIPYTLSAGNTPELASVRGVPSPAGPAYWYVKYKRYNGLEWVDAPFTSLEEIVLNSGESLSFTFVEDLDGDSLTGRLEAAYGCDGEDIDSDGDGISDYEELTRGLNPGNPDTDFDGLNDGIDPDPKAANFYNVSAGHSHSLMVNAGGELFAWGSNRDPDLTGRTTNVLGIMGADTVVTAPTPVNGDTDWALASAGVTHSSALKKDGMLYTWGDNSGTGDLTWYNPNVPHRDTVLTCQLGWTTAPGSTATPNPVNYDTDWVYVSAGYNQTHALKKDGSHWAWGDNRLGALGTGYNSADYNCYPALVGGQDDRWVWVDAGRNLHYAIKSDGTLWAAGADASHMVDLTYCLTIAFCNGYYHFGWGNLLPGIIKPRSKSFEMGDNGIYVQAVCNGSETPCVYDAYLPFHLARGTTVTGVSYDPQQIGEDANWVSVDASLMTFGEYYSYADDYLGQYYVENTAFGLATNSKAYLYGWGDNDFGQLLSNIGVGASQINLIDNPEIHAMGTNWYQVSAGGGHVLGIKMDGTLWAWGRNSSGQLGRGTTSTYGAYPVQIGTENKWIMVSAGYNYSLAIKSDGTVWAWGKDDKGQVGDGNTVGDKWSPVYITTIIPPSP